FSISAFYRCNGFRKPVPVSANQRLQQRVVGGAGGGAASGWLGLRRGGGFVDQILELFTRFEVRDAFGRDLHPGAGFRISADARLALASAETAESAYFDF